MGKKLCRNNLKIWHRLVAKFPGFLCVILLLFIFPLSATLPLQNQRAVLEQAVQENRAVIAVFLYRVETCPWSQKMRSEVLENESFLEKIREDALVWQIELKGAEDEASLCEKYHVKECPTILILDPQGREFARLGILPIDGNGYGKQIQTIIEDFQEVCCALEQNEALFDSQYWQVLYEKANRFSVPCYREFILEKGVEREEGVYFHLEKYARLLTQFKKNHRHLARLKERILKRDKDNRYGARLQLAIAEFSRRTAGGTKKENARKDLKPLLKFAGEWRKKDSAHVWQAEKIIAEYLFSKNFPLEALEHAKTSYVLAPENMKKEISEMIALIEEKVL